MAPLRSLGNPDISSYDDVFCATGKRYNHEVVAGPVWYGDRGVFMGGYSGNQNTIDYIDITSAGNATDFGNLNHSTRAVAPASNGSRGLAMGGRSSSPGPDTAVDYITIGTPGNATDFGDTTTNAGQGYAAGSSNGTRAIVAGGDLPGTADMEYFTIATPGNGTDFGDLTVARYGLAGCSNGTRSVFGGKYGPGVGNNIDYVATSTTGDATDFGDLTVSRGYIGSGQNTPGGRGFWSGGSGNNTLDYVTIASAGNATDFGDASGQSTATSATSNDTRGIIGGHGTGDDKISYITISSTGNSTDFGDLTVGRGYIGATSGD